MSQEELAGIAKELGISAPEDDKMGLIYQIIDEESILSASQKATTTKTPRKRTRIAKKEPDRVYSASQGNGENFDLKKKNTSEAQADSETATAEDSMTESVPAAESQEEQVTAKLPKKRPAKKCQPDKMPKQNKPKNHNSNKSWTSPMCHWTSCKTHSNNPKKPFRNLKLNLTQSPTTIKPRKQKKKNSSPTTATILSSSRISPCSPPNRPQTTT